MARETKVGLLAGLAFIICFAVILANRGVNSPPGAANAFLPNGGLELPKVMQRNPAPAPAPTANIARNRAPVVRPPVQQPAANQPGTHLAANEAVPGTGAQLPLGATPEPMPARPDSSLVLNTRPIDPPANPNAGMERTPIAGSRPEYVLRNDATSPTMTATPSPASQPIGLPTGLVQPPPSQPAPPVQGTPYTVKASDTLSSIAAAHLGSKSKKAVESIFEANRNVMADINSLKVGTVLMIPKPAPVASEKAQPAEAGLAPGKPTPASEKVAQSKDKEADKPASKKDVAEKKPAKKADEQVAGNDKNPANIKWYQVKKNDRFASIARDQLGDAGRWHEVYEMNKDKFPDPQKIREGVRIKLPPATTLAAAGKEKGR